MNEWTTTPPAVAGWYWWRSHKKAMSHCRWVTEFEGVLGVFHQAHWMEFKRLGGEWRPRKIEEKFEWISRADELPPPHVDFIALNGDGRIFRSRMCYGMHEPWFTYPQGDKNASDTAPAWINVTHWIPMPDGVG